MDLRRGFLLSGKRGDTNSVLDPFGCFPAVYNTASEEEKLEIDEKKLCRFMGKLMFALASCWLVAALSEVFHLKALLWVGIALFLVVAIGGVIYANTGHRFDKDW